MRNKILFSLAFLFILFSLNFVSAPGPNYHLNVLEKGLSEENTTLIAKIIQNNYDACLSGLMYADVGIFEYYTNFKAYKSLHNYNTVDEMLRIAENDRQRAFAYCFKIHLGPDGISHNYYVPKYIKKTKLPNYVVHAPSELILESKRGLDPRANRLMENHKEFDDFVTRASGRDWSGEADKLNTIMGGGNFYTLGFVPQSTTTFGKMQRGFFWLIGKIIPNIDDTELYTLSVEEVKNILRGGTSQLDPSGEMALLAADKETQLWLYIGTFIGIGLIFFISFKKRWIGFR